MEEGALAVAEAGTLHVLNELLGSSDSEIRHIACRLLCKIQGVDKKMHTPHSQEFTSTNGRISSIL
jgi:hypothetical protein